MAAVVAPASRWGLLNALVTVLLIVACGPQQAGVQVHVSVAPASPTATQGVAAPEATLAPNSCSYKELSPDPSCTPGATSPAVTQDTNASRTSPAATICTAGYARKVRPPFTYTEPIKKEALAAYGDVAPPAAYELDHLIPLELGGSPTSRRNLWPEPWEHDRAHPAGFMPAGEGAQTKDKVETELNRRVCSAAGSPIHMTLAEAQKLIAADWHGLAVSYGFAT